MGNYSESYLGLYFLMATLKADSTLAGLVTGGIWRELVPPTTVPPFVIVGQQASSDALTANAYRLWSNLLYRVEAHGMAAQADTLAQAAAQIDKLLGGPPGLPLRGVVIINGVTEGVVLSTYRESSLQLDEIVSTTVQWSRFGGLYRMQVEQVAT